MHGVQGAGTWQRWPPRIRTAIHSLHPDILQELLDNAGIRPTMGCDDSGSASRPAISDQPGHGAASFCGPFDQDDDPAGVAPLLSQPIVEVCLRIPVDLQMRGRRDRSLTRLAFSQDQPPR